MADNKGFQSLLQAIEAEDTEGRIEINIYLTAKIEYVSLTSTAHPKSTGVAPSAMVYNGTNVQRGQDEQHSRKRRWGRDGCHHLSKIAYTFRSS